MGWKMHFIFKQSFFRGHLLVFGGVVFFECISPRKVWKNLSAAAGEKGGATEEIKGD